MKAGDIVYAVPDDGTFGVQDLRADADELARELGRKIVGGKPGELRVMEVFNGLPSSVPLGDGYTASLPVAAASVARFWRGEADYLRDEEGDQDAAKAAEQRALEFEALAARLSGAGEGTP